MNTQEEIQKRTAIKNSAPATPAEVVQTELVTPDNTTEQKVETPQNGGDPDIRRQPQTNILKPGDGDIIAENSFVAKKEPTPTELLGTAKTYVDVVNAFGKPKELTPEEQEKERKREKAKAIISAISDGVSAVANMYYTSKGAISTNLGPTLSEQNKKRYDAVIAKRESEQQAYINRLMEAGFKDQAEAAQKELDRSRQAHQSAENQKNRDNQVAMQDSQQTYQSGQNELNRKNQKEIDASRQAHDLKSLNMRMKNDWAMLGARQKADTMKEAIKASKTQSGDYVLLGADGVTEYKVPKAKKDSVIATAYAKLKDIATSKGDKNTIDELELAYVSGDTVAEMAAKLSMFIGRDGYRDVEDYYKKALGGSNQGEETYQPTAQNNNVSKSNPNVPKGDYSQFKNK